MDILFLKDISPLLKYEFITQWGNQNYGNNAELHFKKGSQSILLVYKLIDIQCSQPYVLFRYNDKNFIILLYSKIIFLIHNGQFIILHLKMEKLKDFLWI